MPDQAPAPNRENSSLPVPYTNPWTTLGEDLRSVIADLRLRCQEVWRRNREGDLYRPEIWPQDLAPLFWPLLLALALVVISGGAVALGRWLPSPPVGEAQPEFAQTPEPAPALPSLPTESPWPEPQPRLSADETPDQLDPRSDTSAPVDSIQEEAAVAAADPLLALLLESTDPLTPAEDEAALLTAALPLPARNAVALTISDAWLDLSQQRRQQLADLWWERLGSEGYAELTLVSSQGIQLGRNARVGQGMVVNQPFGPPPSG
ncbi:hypothetical protein [Synechococcus sp. UW140]|uniref:hypothetical protein n=1 Tax=Synechococcus sp. UW140 TaxID=368503 RepID=UPI000E0F0ADB|nr:hypothetical protein [Synechococcus sp. UW140]